MVREGQLTLETLSMCLEIEFFRSRESPGMVYRCAPCMILLSAAILTHDNGHTVSRPVNYRAHSLDHVRGYRHECLDGLLIILPLLAVSHIKAAF